MIRYDRKFDMGSALFRCLAVESPSGPLVSRR
jgi:hypothetical protein